MIENKLIEIDYFKKLNKNSNQWNYMITYL